ncbi:hypothetical protein M426DRAFT_7897 [Hypoxylon sp. CI-4A]|nr:hypothetical protein M426DRAFT_7897 [Hypoxylon sp. CI-4A]
MGQASSLQVETEIAAPPELVRSIFMDFPKQEQWHHIFSLTTVHSNQEAIDLKPGDKISVDIKGYAFKFAF